MNLREGDTPLPFSGGSVSGDPKYVAQAVNIDRDMAAQQRAWIDQLRAAGVKAAHPDDGWVKRDQGYFQFAYPQFNDKPTVGDVVALGSPWNGHRLVRITRIEEPHPIWVGDVRDTGYHWHYEAA